MIINIRGTSGSGKTYIVRQLMEQLGNQQLVHGDGEYFRSNKVVAHCCHHKMQPVYFLGNYSGAKCGGCDTIKTQNLVCSLVRYFSQFGHVVFEGLLMSHLYSRYVSLYEELERCGEDMVFLYLDTPIDVCLDRIKQRRLQAGNVKPLKPDNTISKHESTHRCYAKMEEAGLDVRWLHYSDDMVSQLMPLLDEWPFVNSYKEQSFR